MSKYCKFVLLCLIATLLSSCSDDDDNSYKYEPKSKVQALVACEGTFQNGNASIDVLLEDKSVILDPFQKVNNRPIGDVAQSLTVIDGKIFAALNNSQKIEVVDLKTFKSLETILYKNKTISPQYIAKISDDEAIVSDLGNTMWIFNTKTYEVKEEITTPMATTKQMLLVGNKLFVTMGGKKIIVISVDTKQIIKTLDIPAVGNSKLVLDKDGYIWTIACDYEDDPYSSKPVTDASLYRIDPSSYATTQINLPSNYSVGKYDARLDIDKAKNQLFINAIIDPTYESWVVGGDKAIFKVSITDTAFPTTPLFKYDEKIQSLYNMAVSPSGNIFICDALDYSQNGWVYEYSQNGNLLNEYKTGISPQDILFINE